MITRKSGTGKGKSNDKSSQVHVTEYKSELPWPQKARTLTPCQLDILGRTYDANAIKQLRSENKKIALIGTGSTYLCSHSVTHVGSLYTL